MRNNYILRKSGEDLAGFDVMENAFNCIPVLNADAVIAYETEYTADEFAEIVGSVYRKDDSIKTMEEIETEDREAIREYVYRHEADFKTDNPDSVDIWEIMTDDGFYLDTILSEYIPLELNPDRYYRYIADIVCSVRGWRIKND